MVQTLSSRITTFLLFLCVFAFIYPSSIFSQTPASTTLPEVAGDNSWCSVVGNNLAVPFSSGGGDFDEGTHTLGILNSEADVPAIISAINSYSGTVIVRIGASTQDLGPEKELYAQYLNEIAAAVDGKPFIAMANHNESNGQEGPVACVKAGGSASLCDADPFNPSSWNPMQDKALEYETSFARYVVSNVTASNITFITGQFDNYFNSSPGNDNSNTAKFADAILAAGGGRISGVALPLYTTPGFPTGQAAYDLLISTYNSIEGSPDLYITESGPFSDYNTGFDSLFEEYLHSVQLTISDTTMLDKLKALLLFNAKQLNGDDLFRYTAVFDENCRAALRDTCFDTDVVLEACDGIISAPICEYEYHSCRCLCSGTNQEPCKFSPEYDCSLPFDPEHLLAPEDQLPEQTSSLEIFDYIKEFLDEHAVMENGVKLSFEIDTTGEQTCLPGGEGSEIATSICSQFEGEVVYQIDLDDKHSTVVPTTGSETRSLLSHITTYFTSPFMGEGSPDGMNEFEQGVLEKSLTDQDIWRYRMALMELKETCYQQDRVIPWQNSDTFGKVRCMNYQYFGENCSNCNGIENERELYSEGPSPLRSCIGLHKARGVFYKRKYIQCTQAYQNLPKELRDTIWELPYIPKATLPIFGGIDQTVSTEEPSDGDGVGFSYFKWVSNLLGNFQNIAQNKLHSVHYVKTAVVSQDALVASSIAKDNFTPRNYKVTVPDAAADYTTNIFGWDSELPFYILDDVFNAIIGRLFGSVDPALAKYFDPRFLHLENFLNRYAGECLSSASDLDRADTETPLPVYGEAGTEITNVVDNLSNLLTNFFSLTNLLNQESIPDSGEYQLKSFLRCEIYPSGLRETDFNANIVERMKQPKRDQKHIDERQDRKNPVNAKSSYDGAFISECAEGTAENPPGFGDNECVVSDGATLPDGTPVVTDYQKEVWCETVWVPKEACWDEYCDYGATPCPEKPVMNADGEVESGSSNDNSPFDECKSEGNSSSCYMAHSGNRTLTDMDYFSYVPYRQNPNTECKYLYQYLLDPESCNPPALGEETTDLNAQCEFSGGFEIQDDNIKAIIANKAKEYDVPVEMFLAVLYGENCRSSTSYNGKTASICDDPASDHEGFLNPGDEWGFTAGCPGDTRPSGAGVLQANTLFKNAYYNSNHKACSIYDNFDTAGIAFTDYARRTGLTGKPASDWSLDDMQQALFLWVWGDGRISSCSDPDPSGGIALYCAILQQLVDGDSTYRGDGIPTLTKLSTNTCN